MEIQELISFTTIVQQGSFSKASKKLDYCPKCGCKLKGYSFSDFIKMARSKIDETLNDKF